MDKCRILWVGRPNHGLEFSPIKLRKRAADISWSQIQVDSSAPTNDLTFDRVMNEKVIFGNYQTLSLKGKDPIPLSVAYVRKDVWDQMMALPVDAYTLELVKDILRQALERTMQEIGLELEINPDIDRRTHLHLSYNLPEEITPDPPGRVGLRYGFVSFAIDCVTEKVTGGAIEAMLGEFAELCFMRIHMECLNREWAPSKIGPQVIDRDYICRAYEIFHRLSGENNG